MPSLTEVIADVVRGDDLEITRTITNVNTGDLLNRVWLTLKRLESDDDVDAFLRKEVTAVDNPGQGQLTDNGAGDGNAAVRFDLTTLDTDGADRLRPYFYDIQVRTVAGKIYTPEKGTITFIGDVTLDIT